MERNENGYPKGGGSSSGNNQSMDDGNRIVQENNNESCPESNEATLFDKPLAYAYVPIQRWRLLYPMEKSLSMGTLFEELYKPMEVYGNE